MASKFEYTGPLLVAAYAGNLAEVARLLDGGAEPNAIWDTLTSARSTSSTAQRTSTDAGRVLRDVRLPRGHARLP